VGLRDCMMSTLQDAVDCGAQGIGHAVFATGKDGGPRSIEEDVADTGFTMQQDGDSALEGLDGWDAVALHGWHEEEMRGCEEVFEVLVGDEAVKVDAVADT